VDPAYSLLPVERGFNWNDAFADVDAGKWYLVVFRSKHRAYADEGYLAWLDREASKAAMRTPGFMYYFMGVPMKDGHCLSFCLWQTQEAARIASADPAHREAMICGLPSFEYYDLERYHVRKSHGLITFERLHPEVHGQRPVDDTTHLSDPIEQEAIA
jgi:hypothetical protein